MDVSPIPEIEFIGFDKNSITQGNFDKDTVMLSISFIDGDGDLSESLTGNRPRIIVLDGRTNESYQPFNLPNIPKKGITKGIMQLSIFNTCCQYEDSSDSCENVALNKLRLLVTLIDASGNRSNTIETPALDLICSCNSNGCS